jgi:SAM-dependent methyltransferase
VAQIERRIAFYDTNAKSLASTYESVSFDDLHAPLCALLRDHLRLVLDIGAGSGRDAAALVRYGYDVTAVEPSKEMREQASVHHPAANIRWLDDRLPDLAKLNADERRYDLVLLSAVVMHLHPEEIAPSFTRVSELLAPHGLVYVTLRMGPASPERELRLVEVDTVVEAARAAGLNLMQVHEIPDALHRSGVAWKAVVFRRQPVER